MKPSSRASEEGLTYGVPMGRKVLLLLGTLTAVSLSSVACSDDSDSGGSGGSTGSAGSTSGGTGYACYLDTTKQCTQVANAPAAAVAQAKMTCDTNGGVSSDKCPSAGLLGCCANGGASCYYMGLTHDAAKLSDACGKGGGTWQTTVP